MNQCGQYIFVDTLSIYDYTETFSVSVMSAAVTVLKNQMTRQMK